jgi:ribonuclease P protein component
MIKSLNRLKDSRAVNKVLQRGFKVLKPDFTVRILKGGDQPIRLTVVVGKKISNSAVVRNRTKRRVREAFIPYMENKRGVSVVVFPKQQAIETDFEKLKNEAKECLNQVV